MIKGIIEQVYSVIEAAGYHKTEEVFTFENVPSTMIDNACRIEVASGLYEEESGGKIDKEATLDVWLTRKLPARDKITRYNDTMEKIEEEIEKPLWRSSLQLTGSNSESSQENDCIVVCLHLTVRYELTL